MSRDRRRPDAGQRYEAARARGRRLTIFVLTAAAIVATATARVSAASPTRDAVVSGFVRVCGGPAPGGCRIEAFGDCQPPMGCVTSHRVAAINAKGKQVAVQRLRHARFHMRLAPGRYTIELLGGGSGVHNRVMQRKHVTARADRAVVVPFEFDVP